jgi:dihydroorotate dehydrogenase (NAD+) catalytic subunit
VALEAVWRIARAVDIPVIGSGGISSVEDAEKFFAAGASAVQVGTAIFYDPGLPERIVAELAKKGIPRAIGAKSSLRES